MHDTIIIGGGHNGLTAAFYLAKAGRKPLVLERRSIVGGAAITEALAPGFRCPTLAHATGPLRPSVVRDMQLGRRGVEFLESDPRLVALDPEGRSIAFYTDVAKTAEAIRTFSPKDADRYPEFCDTVARLGGFLSHLLEDTPPSLSGTSVGDLWALIKTGRRFRALSRTDRFRLLRWGPMPVADLLAEWFETDLLQAALAARGIFGTAQGPWSAGTGALLLLHAGVDPAPAGRTVTVTGGPGVLTSAMAAAAREAGAEIRVGADVARVAVRNGHAVGVRLADGTELAADAVVANTDPRRTFLTLVDPVDLDPGFVTKARNYRSKGTVAKLNFALAGLPVFRGVHRSADLHARLHIGPGIDYLERAFDASKYGDISAEPYLEVTIPTLQDPGLAPAGRHILSVYMQFAPYSLANRQEWSGARDVLAARTLLTLERYAPGVSSLIEHQQVITPIDLEETYGLTGGHIFHGEPALDQLFTMRPILGWAQYLTPIHGLYLCGAGAHPGGGLTAGPGQNAARAILEDLKRSGRRQQTQSRNRL